MSNKYFEIDDEGKKLFITQTTLKTGLPDVVVEKDLGHMVPGTLLHINY